MNGDQPDFGPDDRCNGRCRCLCLDCGGGSGWNDEDDEPMFVAASSVGLCAFCGTPLASDGSRQCSCRSTITGSNLGDVGTAAAMRAREHGREVPDSLDVRLVRDRLRA